ncbi:STAS domain-containing protein [Magnetococcus sp. PR-3]|uniref:STAS domain-containing protein n=1 Tax=Magnetococcus sp. PR-3 TaxID=3120355 RepID=UPI002FCE0977
MITQTVNPEFALKVDAHSFCIIPQSAPGFYSYTPYLELAERIPDHLDVVIDCTKIEVMDSVGLGVFLLFHQALGEKAYTIAIRNLHPKLERLFKVAGLDQVFRLV